MLPVTRTQQTISARSVPVYGTPRALIGVVGRWGINDFAVRELDEFEPVLNALGR